MCEAMHKDAFTADTDVYGRMAGDTASVCGCMHSRERVCIDLRVSDDDGGGGGGGLASPPRLLSYAPRRRRRTNYSRRCVQTRRVSIGHRLTHGPTDRLHGTLGPWASALRGKWGHLTPLGKMDEKLKSENMQKKEQCSICFCYILGAIGADRCRERRYADHIFRYTSECAIW